MTHFRLSRKEAGPVLTKFHILDSAGSIVGSINVQTEDADDLEKHWVASAPAPARAAVGRQENPMIGAMLRAAPRNGFSKQAILRSS